MRCEYRGHRGPYYYRTVRRGTKTIKVYCGSGVIGWIAGEIDALTKAEQKANRDAHRVLEERLDHGLAALRRAGVICDLVANALLLAAGYHRSGRHGWRRWYAGQRWLGDSGGTGLHQTVEGTRRTQGGMPSVLPMIRTMVHQDREVWEFVMDVVRQTDQTWRNMGSVEDNPPSLSGDRSHRRHGDLTATGTAPEWLLIIMDDMIATLEYAERVGAQKPISTGRRTKLTSSLNRIQRRLFQNLTAVKSLLNHDQDGSPDDSRDRATYGVEGDK